MAFLSLYFLESMQEKILPIATGTMKSSGFERMKEGIIATGKVWIVATFFVMNIEAKTVDVTTGT